MSSSQPTDAKLVRQCFQNALNRHGHGLQYAVVKEIEQSGCPWGTLIPEFPIEIAGRSTQIDIVAKNHHNHFYLLAECKRCNPNMSVWCFARSQFPKDERTVAHVEGLRDLTDPTLPSVPGMGPPPKDIVSDLAEFFIGETTYSVGHVIKKPDVKGESGDSGRDAIGKAATQICQGLNGLVNYFQSHTDLWESNVVFIPLIITTAELWTTNTDLADASLTTGKLADLVNIERKDFVLWDYHQSPALKHSVAINHWGGKNVRETLRLALRREYTRTLSVVNADHISDFLNRTDFNTRFPIDWHRR